MKKNERRAAMSTLPRFLRFKSFIPAVKTFTPAIKRFAPAKSLASALVGGVVLCMFFFEAGLADSFSQQGAVSALAISLGVTLLRGSVVSKNRFASSFVASLDRALGPLLIFLCYPRAGTFFLGLFIFLFQSVQLFEQAHQTNTESRTVLLSNLGVHADLARGVSGEAASHTSLLLPGTLSIAALAICFVLSTLSIFAATLVPEAARFLKGVPFAAFAVAILSVITSTNPEKNRKELQA